MPIVKKVYGFQKFLPQIYLSFNHIFHKLPEVPSQEIDTNIAKSSLGTKLKAPLLTERDLRGTYKAASSYPVMVVMMT